MGFIFIQNGGDKMKISRKTAMMLWNKYYGNGLYAEDFHGYLMCRDGYGDDNYYIWHNGERIYCGWNIHHIMPVSKGGSHDFGNLICTNIATNESAEDKTTYWIDDCLYQVRRIKYSHKYEILRLN